jgi:hypothetical protein
MNELSTSTARTAERVRAETAASEPPRPSNSLRGALRRHVDRLLGEDLFELGASMTLVMIALSLHESFWYIKAGVLTLAVSGIVIRSLLRSPLLWFGLVAVFVLSYSTTWPGQNNHDFLKLYWCLGVGASLLAADQMRAVRFNARLLIGICFLFAVVWKVVDPDYLSHDFFNYFLLQDSRFGLITENLGGVGAAELRAGQLERVLYTAFGDPEGSVAVPLAAEVAWIAPLMTWWTLLIEGLVAVAFLLPEGWGLSRWRDATLLTFAFSTYFVAPILYFAWLLIAMAVIQCDRTTFRFWPVAYTAAFVLILMRFYVPV